MKKIDLGNNVNVEVTEEGFKITLASGSTILLDCNGEFLNYTNEVGMKQAKEKKEFFEKFIKFDKGKREIVFDWIRSYDGTNNEMRQNFFFNLGQAMAEVEYDYYIAEFKDVDEMIDVMNISIFCQDIVLKMQQRMKKYCGSPIILQVEIGDSKKGLPIADGKRKC